ncbi:unnamed protein product [Polarella glacialis]|uniref:Uncharacterized protein n=1 Tax=Polarella glacialis TaxID=89957 RepID=A0A813GMV2_POLGL|nr:unnamed protein product [Polarella glacialis]
MKSLHSQMSLSTPIRKCWEAATGPEGLDCSPRLQRLQLFGPCPPYIHCAPADTPQADRRDDTKAKEDEHSEDLSATVAKLQSRVERVTKDWLAELSRCSKFEEKLNNERKRADSLEYELQACQNLVLCFEREMQAWKQKEANAAAAAAEGLQLSNSRSPTAETEGLQLSSRTSSISGTEQFKTCSSSTTAETEGLQQQQHNSATAANEGLQFSSRPSSIAATEGVQPSSRHNSISETESLQQQQQQLNSSNSIFWSKLLPELNSSNSGFLSKQQQQQLLLNTEKIKQQSQEQKQPQEEEQPQEQLQLRQRTTTTQKQSPRQSNNNNNINSINNSNNSSINNNNSINSINSNSINSNNNKRQLRLRTQQPQAELVQSPMPRQRKFELMQQPQVTDMFSTPSRLSSMRGTSPIVDSAPSRLSSKSSLESANAFPILSRSNRLPGRHLRQAEGNSRPSLFPSCRSSEFNGLSNSADEFVV